MASSAWVGLLWSAESYVEERLSKIISQLGHWSSLAYTNPYSKFLFLSHTHTHPHTHICMWYIWYLIYICIYTLLFLFLCRTQTDTDTNGKYFEKHFEINYRSHTPYKREGWWVYNVENYSKQSIRKLILEGNFIDIVRGLSNNVCTYSEIILPLKWKR